MSRDNIEHLLHTYADAVCRRDPEQWISTWDESAVWELGKGRQVEGKDAILALWNGAMDGFCAVVQNVVNSACELDEEAGTGTGRSYIMEHWHRANDDRGMLLAYYDDNYIRVDGTWRFASRELVPQYSGAPDLSGVFLNAWASPETNNHETTNNAEGTES